MHLLKKSLKNFILTVLFVLLIVDFSHAATEVATAPLHTRIMHMLPTAKVWKIVNNNDAQASKNWWGLRGNLEEKGLTFNFVYTQDTAFNVDGGTKRGSVYMDNLDMSLTLDTEKMKLWPGGSLFIYGVINGGSSKRLTGNLVGDLQGVGNIEAPRSTRLMELWYQQLLFNEKLSILLGIHDLNSEFDTTEYGGLFFNGSFGIQPTMTGNFTAPLFPLASAALRVKVKPTENLELLSAVYDGDPRSIDDGNPHGWTFTINKEDSVLNINEIDYHIKLPDYKGGEALPGTVKVGGWYLARSFDDVVEVYDVDGVEHPVRHDGNWGIYGVIDQMIYREQDDQGIGVFLQMSGAPSNRNTVAHYTGFGMNYRGAIPQRDEDIFGVAYNIATISDRLRSSSGQEATERVLELTYLIQITPAITLQPDIQFVENPNADPAIRNATVIMLRGSVSF